MIIIDQLSSSDAVGRAKREEIKYWNTNRRCEDVWDCEGKCPQDYPKPVCFPRDNRRICLCKLIKLL